LLPTEEMINSLSDSIRMLTKALEEVQTTPNPTLEIPQALLSHQTNILHKDHIEGWIKAMRVGLIGGRPFSQNTIDHYDHYVSKFIKRFKALTINNLRRELADIDPVSFGKREKLYKGLICFAKYLIDEGVLDASFLEQAKPLTPKRHLPPKRLTVSAVGLEAMINACSSVYDKTLVVLLASTGLRASEFCELKRADIDLENQILTVRCGKGGKNRRVGLNRASTAILIEYLTEYPKQAGEYLFHNADGVVLNRWNLLQRIDAIGKKAGVKATCHSLRRAFVTINAKAGKPLPILQRACGHTTARMTEAYCQIQEHEVIEAMKEWDE
jgi:integrase/recombinase XerD